MEIVLLVSFLVVMYLLEKRLRLGLMKGMIPTPRGLIVFFIFVVFFSVGLLDGMFGFGELTLMDASATEDNLLMNCSLYIKDETTMTITQDEVTDLYNGGEGITIYYTDKYINKTQPTQPILSDTFLDTGDLLQT